nr:unnamed protein product [Callosobruchus chinensis]
MSDQENWGEDDDNDPDYVPPVEIENGHVTSTTEDDSESSDDDVPTTSTNGEFNTDLPTAHKYLGRLKHVSGYTLYDDGETLEVLAIYTTTMAFPGFTLPLVMNNHSEMSVMQTYIRKNSVFVLICANSKLNGLFEYGVTMEVFESQVRNNALHIKAKGRQRCKLLGELKNWGGQLKQVNVKIMAEPEITSPICNTQMYTLKRRRPYTSKNYCDISQNHKYRRYHLCQYPIESWVYDKYEVSYYVKLLLEGLSNYVGEYIPDDPVMLSYWFAQNYLLLHEERLHLLQLNSALERLRMEYNFLKRVRTIRCSGCDLEISDPSKVFAMSKDGIQSNYVNPGGHNYETVTVTSVQNFQLEGKPSKQFSWFPGYAWTIMHCKNCGKHLGWRYTSSTSKPYCFYGLAKGGIKVDIEGGWHGTKLRLFTAIFEETRGTTFSRDYIPL